MILLLTALLNVLTILLTADLMANRRELSEVFRQELEKEKREIAEARAFIERNRSDLDVLAAGKIELSRMQFR